MLETPKLILGLVPVHNRLSPTAAEIFIAVLGQSSNSFLQTCIPTVMENGVIRYYQNQPYVVAMTNNVRDASRYMDYAVHKEILLELLEREQKHIWLGTGRPSQLETCKEVYGDKRVTLSMNYDETLIRNIAMDFLAIASFYNVKVFESETVQSLCEKIPKTFHYPADIEINLADVYDLTKLENLLITVFNEKLNETKLNIYNEWVKEQNKLKEKYEDF